ncbi:MAG: glutamate mutase L [Chloroflexota bacterium]
MLWAKDADGEFRLRGRAEAPTTVEAPWEDVTLGLTSAVEKLEAATGLRILSGGEIITPPRDGVGVDLYISTSSAGGGLQMVVAGVMKRMTADSADRAAQAAGGIVTDILSIDDGRLLIERIQRLRELRPDIILLSGGVDGGDISHVVNLAEQVAIAEPRTRLGNLRTPLVYAGNAAARPHMLRLLEDKVSLHVVDNIRPVLERENIEPARQMIHLLFMEHVMSQAPGYPRLLEWSRNALLPTPGAVGRAIQAFGTKYGINVAAFDIGGATTDVFSLVGQRFHRTVSANLGMSYSATNVLAEATTDAVLRWLPFPCTAAEIEDWAANKMIRPTSLPQTLEDLIIEQALAREALRLAFSHHCSAIDGLKGVQRRRDMSEVLDQVGAQSAIDLLAMDALIGSGGVLSHAPRREQALMMLVDSLLPEGVTEMFVDSIFMSPQLGLLSTIRPQLATEILERDGLCLLATCIAPVGRPARNGRLLAHLTYRSGREHHSARIVSGQIVCLPLKPGAPYEVTIYPRRGYDCGAGPGRPVETVVEAGLFGLVLDGRGRRPLAMPADPAQRITALRSWLKALSVYDDRQLDELSRNRDGR